MKYVDADIYTVSYATAPFTTSVSIETCIEKVKSGEYDSAFLAEKCQAFLWRDGKPLNFDAQNFPRTQDLPLIYKEAPGAYVFSKETFLKYNRRVGERVYIHEIDEIEGWDIDYPEDFILAGLIYQGIFTPPPPPPPHTHPRSRYRSSTWLKCSSGLPSFKRMAA